MVAMMKDAPHPNAAKLYLNMQVLPEFQQKIAQVLWISPNLQGVPVPDPLVSLEGRNVPVDTEADTKRNDRLGQHDRQRNLRPSSAQPRRWQLAWQLRDVAYEALRRTSVRALLAGTGARGSDGRAAGSVGVVITFAAGAGVRWFCRRCWRCCTGRCSMRRPGTPAR